MIRDIVRDINILQQVSKMVNPNAKETKQIIQDLIDTAEEHRGKCVGLSAIQIGEPVRVFVAYRDGKFLPFVNPVIREGYGGVYDAEEGCMSLDGKRVVKRYNGVVIVHQKGNKFVKEHYGGYFAQILQHEADHLQGKLI